MPIQLIDISSSHSTLLFFLAWQKNVFPPLLPIVPTPCGTFYKGPTRPLLSIGKSIIKDSVNMNVARIHILFKNQRSWSFVFWSWYSESQLPSNGSLKDYIGLNHRFEWIAAHNLYFLTFWQSFREYVLEFKVFSQRWKQVDQTNSYRKWTALKKRRKTTWCANTSWRKKGKRREG